MRTLKQLQKDIDLLLQNHPEWANLPIIYSSDDEGNSYQKVYNELSPTQIHNLNEWNLEMVGFLGEDEIDERDINCICIN